MNQQAPFDPMKGNLVLEDTFESHYSNEVDKMENDNYFEDDEGTEAEYDAGLYPLDVQLRVSMRVIFNMLKDIQARLERIEENDID